MIQDPLWSSGVEALGEVWMGRGRMVRDRLQPSLQLWRASRQPFRVCVIRAALAGKGSAHEGCCRSKSVARSWSKLLQPCWRGLVTPVWMAPLCGPFPLAAVVTGLPLVLCHARGVSRLKSCDHPPVHTSVHPGSPIIGKKCKWRELPFIWEKHVLYDPL